MVICIPMKFLRTPLPQSDIRLSNISAQTASPFPSAQGSAYELSSAKLLIITMMYIRWKGEALFLEWEVKETGDAWWEDEQ